MIDPRERHFVGKLDRYELEDKYLRLMDEMQCLKKLSNRQEDKIKRLATKFMRVSANSRACINVHDICNDKERISTLECENNKVEYYLNCLNYLKYLTLIIIFCFIILKLHFYKKYYQTLQIF